MSFYDGPSSLPTSPTYADVWKGEDGEMVYEIVGATGPAERCASAATFAARLQQSPRPICTVGAHRWRVKPPGMPEFHDILWAMERQLRFTAARERLVSGEKKDGVVVGAEWVRSVWKSVDNNRFVEWTATSGRSARFALPTFHTAARLVPFNQAAGYLTHPATPTNDMLESAMPPDPPLE